MAETDVSVAGAGGLLLGATGVGALAVVVGVEAVIVGTARSAEPELEGASPRRSASARMSAVEALIVSSAGSLDLGSNV